MIISAQLSKSASNPKGWRGRIMIHFRRLLYHLHTSIVHLTIQSIYSGSSSIALRELFLKVRNKNALMRIIYFGYYFNAASQDEQ